MFSRRTAWDRAPNELARALADRRAAGKPVLDLTISNPTRAGLGWTGTELAGILERPGLERYEPAARGALPAREAISAWLASRGRPAPADCLFLTASTSEAYGFLFKLLCEPGEAVLTPQPSYPLFEFLTGLEGVEQEPYRLRPSDGRWRLSVDELAARVPEQARAVLAVEPNNPTGSRLSARESGELAALCASRSMALIVDEVFADFAWAEERPGPRLAERAREAGALCFGLGGLSKSAGLPQLKLGWITVDGPDRLVGEALDRLEWIGDTYLSVATPIQLAAGGLLRASAGFRDHALSRIRENLRTLRDDLTDTALRLLPGEGGWSVVVELPAGIDEARLCQDLLSEEGVLVHPGAFFELRPAGHLVLSLLTPSDELASGIERIRGRTTS